MYKQKEVVVHNTFGICEIVDIRAIRLKDRPTRKYYVLHSLYDEDSTACIPIEEADHLLRYPMQKDEIMSLVEETPSLQAEWIDEMRLRKETFAQWIREGDPRKLVSVIRCFRMKDEERKKTGKRINDADARQKAQAEKILNEELAFGLGIQPQEVENYLEKHFSIH